MSKPNFKQVLDALKRQVLNGKSYLRIANGLAQADPVILQTAPTFFYMTIDGSLELAQIAAARLYDRTKGAVTVIAMLCDAASKADTFQNGDRMQVDKALLKSVQRVIAIQPFVDAIRRRRNKWLAHLDAETVRDPVALVAKAKLTAPDLERVLGETEAIVLDLSNLYEGVFGELSYIGADDYETALAEFLFITLNKCALGPSNPIAGTWTGPRPNDCSRQPYDLI